MLDLASSQLKSTSVDESSSVSIILVVDGQRQVIDAELTHLEAVEILWLLSQIKKHGFAAVEETLVEHLLANIDHDYTEQF